LLGGWAMDRFGPDGLPYAIAAVFLGFILTIAARTLFSARAPKRV